MAFYCGVIYQKSRNKSTFNFMIDSLVQGYFPCFKEHNPSPLYVINTNHSYNKAFLLFNRFLKTRRVLCLHEVLAAIEQSRGQPEQLPAPLIAHPGRIISQLLHYLTVHLISQYFLK